MKEYPDGDADFWHQAWDVAFIFSQDAMKGGVVTMTHVPKMVSIKGAFAFLRYSKISNKSTTINQKGEKGLYDFPAAMSLS